MAQLPLRRLAAYEDLLAAPDHMVAELVDGELYTSPRPASRHALSSSLLGGELIPPFFRGRGGPGGWIIVFEPELHFGRQIVVPDLAGWRRERMPVYPDVAFFTLAPDWICEVLSPRTESLDRIKKLRVYAKAGVRHAWLLNPVGETLEVLRRSNGRWTLIGLHAGHEQVRAEPFDAIQLDLAALWSIEGRTARVKRSRAPVRGRRRPRRS